MLEFINKRMSVLADEQLKAREIINDLQCSKQAFRQAQNTIIETSTRVAELSLISNELLTRNRAQSNK